MAGLNEKLTIVVEAANNTSPAITEAIKGVKRLDAETKRSTQSAIAQTSATKKLGGAYRSSRMAAQNFAFQIQDIAVQLTSGQAASLVLAQQLPQLISGFGLVGAAIGAAVAIFAGLYRAFDENGSAIDNYAVKLKSLSSDFKGLKTEIGETIETFGNLDKESDTVRNFFAKMSQDIVKSRVSDKVQEIAEEFGGLLTGDGVFGSRRTIRNGLAQIRIVQKEFGISGDAVSDYKDTISALMAQFELMGKAKDIATAAALLRELSETPSAQGADRLLQTLASLTAGKNVQQFGVLAASIMKFRDALQETEGGTRAAISDEVVDRQRKLDRLIAENTAKANDKRFAMYRDWAKEIEKTSQGLAKKRIKHEEDVAQRAAALRLQIAENVAKENDKAVQAIRKQEEENAKRAQQLDVLKAKRRAEANDKRVEEERRTNQRLLKEQEEHNKKVADSLLELERLKARRRAEANDKAVEEMRRQQQEQEEHNKKVSDSLLKLEQLKAKRRAEANDKAVEEMRRQQKEQEDAQKRLSNVISSGFEDAFMSVIDGSKKAGDAFRDFASMVIKQLAKIALQKMVFGPLEQALTGFLSGSSSTVTAGKLTSSQSLINASLGSVGTRASGGPVMGGKTYLIGEKGPELFSPRSSGQITPNHRMGGSGEQIVINQNINVTTGVQQTVRAEILGLMPQITEASKMAVIDAKRRGGSFAGAF